MAKQPDYKLKVKYRDADRRGQTEVGAAWVNEGGHISIALGPGVVLSDRDDIIITLFPNDRRKNNGED